MADLICTSDQTCRHRDHYVCAWCGTHSASPADVRNQFCGACKVFDGIPDLLRAFCGCNCFPFVRALREPVLVDEDAHHVVIMVRHGGNCRGPMSSIVGGGGPGGVRYKVVHEWPWAT